VARPPYRSEWPHLIQEGNVFVYEEGCTGVVNSIFMLDGDFTIRSIRVDDQPITTQGCPSTTLSSGLILLTINVTVYCLLI
jgi:hypothetical protein